MTWCSRACRGAVRVPQVRRRTRFCIALALALVPFAQAQATDAELQAALKGARCGSPTIKQIFQQRDLFAYEANCFGSSHRVLTVTCVKNICDVDEPAGEDERR